MSKSIPRFSSPTLAACSMAFTLFACGEEKGSGTPPAPSNASTGEVRNMLSIENACWAPHGMTRLIATGREDDTPVEVRITLPTLHLNFDRGPGGRAPALAFDARDALGLGSMGSFVVRSFRGETIDETDLT